MNILVTNKKKLSFVILILFIIISIVFIVWKVSNKQQPVITTVNQVADNIPFGGDIIINNGSYNNTSNLQKFTKTLNDNAVNKVINLINTSKIQANILKRATTNITIEFKNKTYSAILVGIEPDNEASAFNLTNIMLNGDYLSSEEYDGAIINNVLATALGAKSGDNITYTTNNLSGNKTTQTVRISGVFSAINSNANLVVINLEAMQSNVFEAQLITSLGVKLVNQQDNAVLVKLLQKSLTAAQFSIKVLQ